jgi:hypothetical protein
VPQLFRWQGEPAGNNTASPSGTLNLLYLSGSGTPAETGLSIASNGQINFASGQTFPGAGTGTVMSVASGAGLTGGPISTSGMLSIATGGVTNAMLANSSLSVLPGTDLAGGGSVQLGGSVTLNLDTTKVPTLAAPSNTFTGSLAANSFSGNGSALSNLNPANLSAGTAGINITGNAATATTAVAASSATTASEVNGGTIPSSVEVLGTNSSGQLVSAASSTACGLGTCFQSSTTTSSVSATQIISSAPATRMYHMDWTLSITTAGTSCAGGTTVAVNAIFTDPNASGAVTETLGTITIGTGANWNGTAGLAGNGSEGLYVKNGTALQYSLAYTAGSACSAAPTVQLTGGVF